MLFGKCYNNHKWFLLPFALPASQPVAAKSSSIYRFVRGTSLSGRSHLLVTHHFLFLIIWHVITGNNWQVILCMSFYTDLQIIYLAGLYRVHYLWLIAYHRQHKLFWHINKCAAEDYNNKRDGGSGVYVQVLSPETKKKVRCGQIQNVHLNGTV